MNKYTFDLPLLVSITISAADPETARQALQERLENCRADFEGLGGEVSLMEDVNIWKHLGMIDGIDCVNQFGVATSEGPMNLLLREVAAGRHFPPNRTGGM